MIRRIASDRNAHYCAYSHYAKLRRFSAADRASCRASSFFFIEKNASLECRETVFVVQTLYILIKIFILLIVLIVLK